MPITRTTASAESQRDIIQLSGRLHEAGAASS